MRTISLLLMVVPVALVAVLMSGCGPAATGGSSPKGQATGRPTADARLRSIPPETAVDYAVRFARSSDPAVRPQLVGDSIEIRGRLMTYPEADRLTLPAASSPSTPHWSLLDEWAIGQDPERLVWLIDVRGSFQKPYSKGEPARRQEIVMLDARTAQVLGFVEREAGHEVDTSSLPPLSMPAGPVPTPFATYTPGPAPTPAPTKAPAPPAPSPARTVPTETGIPATSGGVAVPTVMVVGPGTPTPTQPKVLVSPAEVTLNDRNATVRLTIGQRFLINLSGDPGMYDWTVRVGDESILRRVGDQGQGIYEAARPGETALLATGDPRCRKVLPACGMPSISFELRVQVLGGDEGKLPTSTPAAAPFPPAVTPR